MMLNNIKKIRNLSLILNNIKKSEIYPRQKDFSYN